MWLCRFESCFKTYCAPTLRWLVINAIAIIPLGDTNKISQLLFMLDGLMTEKNCSSLESVDQLVCFCAVWAMGSSLTISDDGTDYRKMFSDWWRSEFKSVKYPPRETVFEYWLNPDDRQLDQWNKSPYFFSIDYGS